MKKIAATVLCISMSAIMLVGCGADQSESSVSDSSVSESSAASAESGTSVSETSEEASNETENTSDTQTASQEEVDFAALVDEAEKNGTVYTSLFTGRWDNQKIEEFEGDYSVYVSEGFEYCSPGVMILTPDNMTASDWLDSEAGNEWIDVAESENIALVVVEPDDGTWNLSNDSGARDDEEYLRKVYEKITSKRAANESSFDLNERALYLVGYNEGATAANKLAMEWPALFAGVAAVGGDTVNSDVASEIGESVSYPFAESTLSGSEENAMPNNEIPVRVWEIENGDSGYWIAVNGLENAESETTEYASVLTNYEEGEARPEQVWYSETADGITADVMYNEFFKNVQRFVGDPGGYLEWTINHENDGEHGYFLTEEKVDGYTRRWYTYVPESYDGTQEYPLVIAIHGYSSAINAFTGDSRWQNVADEYGIIVAFPQAYVISKYTNIPVPVWNNYSVPVDESTDYNAPDDVGFIKHVVDSTKENYAIDSEQVFATGHSNGSAMVYMLALDAPEYFTAVAPIGYNGGSYDGFNSENKAVDYSASEENEYVLPLWCMTGEFDLYAADSYAPNTDNGKTVNFWIAMNGASDEAEVYSEVRATRAEHEYTTYTYTGKNGEPLVRYTAISNNCHSYMEDISFMLWEDFFSHYTRSEDGTLYYDDVVVERVY